MLRYFVMPQKNEAFYSLLARYKEHLNYNLRKVNLKLFGKSTLHHNILLPTHLTDFCKLIGEDLLMTYRQIFSEHTLLPLFEKFNLNIRKYKNYDRPIKFLTTRRHEYFKYCPLCFQQALDSIGEPFWNRIHNIPHIKVCLQHKIRLHEWRPTLHESSKRMIFPASKVSINTNVINEQNPLILKLTAQTTESLSNDFVPEFPHVVTLSKKVGLLKKHGERYQFEPSILSSLNKHINLAVASSGSDCIEINRDIRFLLFRSGTRIDPFSYFTLLSFLETLPFKRRLDTKKTTNQLRKINQRVLFERRKKWEDELNSKDFYSITESRKNLKTEYRWLHNNDSKWIREINAKKRLKGLNRWSCKQGVLKSDEQIVTELKLKMSELIKNKFNRQVSKLLLLKFTEFKYLTPSNLNRLPLTKNFLDTKLESRFEFKKRYIRSTLSSMPKLPPYYKAAMKFAVYNVRSQDQRNELLKIISEYYPKA